jgi:hypothetical protein
MHSDSDLKERLKTHGSVDIVPVAEFFSKLSDYL